MQELLLLELVSTSGLGSAISDEFLELERAPREDGGAAHELLRRRRQVVEAFGDHRLDGGGQQAWHGTAAPGGSSRSSCISMPVVSTMKNGLPPACTAMRSACSSSSKSPASRASCVA